MATMTPYGSDENEEKVTTVIADDLHIKGTITFQNSLMIKGSLEGEIISEGMLVVGPTAKIGATIVTKSLISHGQIVGDVTASDRVVLKGTAVQTGNITTPYIVVENGSTFNGSCVMKREKTAAPVRETMEPETTGTEIYEASEESSGPAMTSGEVTSTSTQSDSLYQSADRGAEESVTNPTSEVAVQEDTDAGSDSGRQTELEMVQPGEPAGSSPEEDVGEEKVSEEAPSESPLRSKWRRRELF
jgi:cytoskeletal protein CcmA (bactofilin family)